MELINKHNQLKPQATEYKKPTRNMKTLNEINNLETEVLNKLQDIREDYLDLYQNEEIDELRQLYENKYLRTDKTIKTLLDI